MTVYFLSGLGSDERVFKHLNLELPKSYKFVYLNWISPIQGESIKIYAKRISEIIDVSSPFILVGLSFGGVIAVEISQYIQPHKLILISSISSRRELPFYFRLAGKIKLYRIIPAKFLGKANFLNYWLFGITNQKDKLILKDILLNSIPDFSIWAVQELLNWQVSTQSISPIRIHGNKDRVLPISNFKPDYLIKGGGHFMIVNKANEISQVLSKELYLR